jgi:hypothetical protein
VREPLLEVEIGQYVEAADLAVRRLYRCVHSVTLSD